MGFLDKFKRGRRPPPYQGMVNVPATERISTGGATPATEKISTGGAAPATEKISTGSAPRPPGQSAEDSGATLYIPKHGNKVVGVLIGIEGQLENEVFRIFDGPNKLGRADSCEVVLATQRISREHALLTHQDDTFTIESLSDRNPTRVNGEPTERSQLSDGDELQLGDATFRFRTVN